MIAVVDVIGRMFYAAKRNADLICVAWLIVFVIDMSSRSG